MVGNYIKTSIRNLSRHRLHSTIHIPGLALGLAAFWLIALYISDEWSYDRYHKKRNRIFRVLQHARWNGNELHAATTSAPFAPAMQAAFPEIETATRVFPEGDGVASLGDKSINIPDMMLADKNIFNVFTWTFLHGSATTALASPHSVVLTETLARTLFKTPAEAMDKTVSFLNGEPCKVTGVINDIPLQSHIRFSALRSLPEDFIGSWQNYNAHTYLLLKAATDIKDLEKKLPAFEEKTMKKLMKVEDYSMELQPLSRIRHYSSHLSFDIQSGVSMSRLYSMSAIALLILLIAVINYMNLSTARSASRLKEVGIRKSIGSGRGALAGMFLAESVLITLAAAIAAIILAYFTIPYFNWMVDKPLDIWRWGTIPTLFVLVLFTLIIGMINGLYPAVFLSGLKTIPALKGKLGDLRGNISLRKGLIIFQFTITVVLMITVAVIYAQMHYAARKDLGFDKDQVVTFHLHDINVREKVDALKERLLQSNKVESVGVAGNPIGNNDLGGLGYRFQAENGEFETSTVMSQELMVDEDYIPTMSIQIIMGRNFSEQMQADQYGAALINETLMKKLGWSDALGKKMRFPIDDAGNTGERTIVGVVKDFHTYSLQHVVAPLVMVMPPAARMRDNLYVKLKKDNIPEGLKDVTRIYREFDAVNPMEYHFLSENFDRQYAAEQKQGVVALTFSLLAVIIANLGLFGLATFMAQQRTKEIGIRKVLGASIQNIVSLFSRDFLKLVVIASLISFPVAWIFLEQWLQHFAYRIAMPVWIYPAAGALACCIAFVTVGLLAMRAALSNPVDSLRME